MVAEAWQTEAVVIGAGVVGLATARVLAEAGLNPLILEAGPRIAEGITSRNSGVIHAGLYYPPASLKARFCVRGNELLYDFAERHNVAHVRLGKLIVGPESGDTSGLEALLANAEASGATGLSLQSARAVAELEPELKPRPAVLSERTGIVDPYELSRALLLAAEAKGASLVCEAAVTAVREAAGHYLLETRRGPIAARIVVNAAGLAAARIAASVGVDKYRIYPCRGDYFRWQTKRRFRHLIYPVKDPRSAGLGVHLTIGLDGSYRLGPDAEYVENEDDFSERAGKLAEFQAAARPLLGEIPLTELSYDTVGIRPKLRGPGDAAERDFVISEDKPGFFNLVGIESPGLTAALAIAEFVGGKISVNPGYWESVT